jgi:hypothetical protein
MTSKLDDLDGLMDDLQTEVSRASPKTTQKVTQPVPELESSDSAVRRRLSVYADKKETYILVPIRNEDGVREGFRVCKLEEATPEEFLSWALYVLPLDSLRDEDPERYKDPRIRESTFLAICDYLHHLKIPCERGLEGNH